MKIIAIILILALFVFFLLGVLQELGKINIPIIAKISYYGNNNKLVLLLYIVIIIFALIVINAIYNA